MKIVQGESWNAVNVIRCNGRCVSPDIYHLLFHNDKCVALWLIIRHLLSLSQHKLNRESYKINVNKDRSSDWSKAITCLLISRELRYPRCVICQFHVGLGWRVLLISSPTCQPILVPLWTHHPKNKFIFPFFFTFGRVCQDRSPQGSNMFWPVMLDRYIGRVFFFFFWKLQRSISPPSHAVLVVL